MTERILPCVSRPSVTNQQLDQEILDRDRAEQLKDIARKDALDQDFERAGMSRKPYTPPRYDEEVLQALASIEDD